MSEHQEGPSAPRSPAASAGLHGCPEPLARRYDVALLDLDGVVYLGRQPISGVPEALSEAGAAGMRLAYVTNNASRTPQQVAGLLQGMQLPAGPEDVVTSAQAAAHVLRERLAVGSAVLVVGAPALGESVAAVGLRPVSAAAERPVAVVQGFSRDVGWEQLAEAMVALRAGAWWVATNADSTLPSPRGPLPGNGAMVAALRVATGQTPLVVGKPERALHQEAVTRTGARRPLVVGDRLDTDIEGAVRCGTDSLLVFTGVTDPAQLLLAAPQRRPTYLARGLDGLLLAHPEVVTGADGVRCGRYVVRSADGALVLVVDGGQKAPEPGDDLDALRALCVATWRGQDCAGGAPPTITAAPDARSALAALGLSADRHPS